MTPKQAAVLPRAVTYARVSSDDRQNDRRNIILGQQELCREYIHRKNYLLIEEVAEDDRGASGKDRGLEGLLKVLALAQAGQFDVLIVREMDRLARGLIKQLLVEEELKACGVRIEYVLGEYPDNPEGRLNKHIKAVIAEYEREKISQRTQRGRRNKVRQGHVSVGGHAPYGYRVKEQGKKNDMVTLVIHEDEATVVRLIFELYTRSANSLSLRQIAAKLTEMRVPTYVDTGVRPKLTKKKNGYGHWNPRAVRSILRNPVYVGRWFYGKGKAYATRQVLQPLATWVEARVPPLIDVETFNLAQQRISENRIFASRTQKYDYLLARRLTCQCGEKIHCIHNHDKLYGKHYFYYRCPVREDPRGRYLGKTCSMPSFRCADVDRTVWGWLRCVLANPDRLEQALEEFEHQQHALLAALELQAGTIRSNMVQAREELSRLIEVYIKTGSTTTRQALQQNQAKLEQAIASAETQLRTVEAEIAVISESVSRDQLKAIGEFVGRLNFALSQDNPPFEVKRQVIEALDVRCRLALENGKKIVYLTTIITPKSQQVEVEDSTGLLVGSERTFQTPPPSRARPA
ncbi:MAG: recombinase family protein [Anaerolineae bacterium]|nr:recombinase family protein [Anaerolineae bacterium]